MAHDKGGPRPSLASSLLEGFALAERDRVLASPERQQELAKLLVRMGILPGVEATTPSGDGPRAGHGPSWPAGQGSTESLPIVTEIAIESMAGLPARLDSPPAIDVQPQPAAVNGASRPSSRKVDRRTGHALAHQDDLNQENKR